MVRKYIRLLVKLDRKPSTLILRPVAELIILFSSNSERIFLTSLPSSLPMINPTRIMMMAMTAFPRKLGRTELMNSIKPSKRQFVNGTTCIRHMIMTITSVGSFFAKSALSRVLITAPRISPTMNFASLLIK